MELAAFFTHCNLQPVHLALSLRSAMTVFFKHSNKATCVTFCRRWEEGRRRTCLTSLWRSYFNIADVA